MLVFLNKNTKNAVITQHTWANTNAVDYQISGFVKETPNRFSDISIGNSPGLFFPDFDR